MGVKAASMSSTELDDDTGRRSTRGRNPLPPTSGPLFPPLPPKIPKVKNSPKLADSSKSPSGSRTSASKADKSASTNSVTSPPPDARSSRSESSKANVASGSGTSLTPPPPDQEDGESDDRLTPEEEEGEGDGNWEQYRRRRTIRAFPGSGGKSSVKAEPADEDEEDEEETPKRTRNGRKLAVPNSGENTPSADAMGSGSDWGTGKPRKRRGEAMLLLDDHLLPEEIRRTGTLAARRASDKPAATAKEEEGDDEGEGEGEAAADEEVDDDKLTEEDPPKEEEEAEVAEEEEEAAEDEGDDDEGGEDDVTRCVCFTMDSDEMMIQCDLCNVWQHGQCIGIWTDEEAPDEYYCEKCRPELHQPLKKWMKNKRTPVMYIPPTPHDLKRLHYASDKYPPSQSKRWSNPSLNTPLPYSPPPRQRKPPSPVRDTGRRGGARTAAKAVPLPPSRRERQAPSAEPTKRQVSHRRKASIDAASPVRESRSPPRSGAEPKRRSTMNSRDAAYEEAVKQALEESRLEALGENDEDAATNDEAVVEDEPRPAERKNKGKRKRDDDDGSVEPHGPNSHGGKPKHPNQYTYRPKPLSQTIAPVAASPMRRGHQGGTPVPVAPPAQHEHGTRRAGALATSAVAQPFTTTTSIHNLHWHLPDHLSLFSDILSTPAPVPLEVRSPRTMLYLPRNHFLNQRYGPISDERDDEGKLIMPDDQPPREAVGDKTTHLEPPARIKYPQRRMTTADLRKRVRSVLDYINRIQVEEGKRGERAKVLGIDAKPLPEKQKRKRKVPPAAEEAAVSEEKQEEGGEEEAKPPNGEVAADGDVEMAAAEKTAPDANGTETEGEPEAAKETEAAAAATPPATEPETEPAPAEDAPPEEAEAEEEEEEEEEEDEDAHIARLTTRSGPTASALLEELAKDIAAFQETLFAGGFATPQPPSSATLPSNGEYHPTSGLAREVAAAMDDEESVAASITDLEPPPVLTESPLAGLGIGLPIGSELEKGMDTNGVDVVLETTDEPVDVYREGKVAKVVSSGSSAAGGVKKVKI